MIKAIVLNLSLQDFCLREIERTLGLPISQLIKILKEISDSYSGGMDAKEILHALGMTDYNPHAIVRRTHGVSYNDYIWFRFPGENLSAKDALVRK